MARRKMSPLGELIATEVYELSLRGQAMARGAATYYRELGYRVRAVRRTLRVEGDNIVVVVVTARKRRDAKET